MSQPRAATAHTTKSPASLRVTMSALLASTVGIFPVLSEALPVIPRSAGFGIETPAGRGGAVIRVTNLNESGAGSLRACVDASGPRVCVFEVSGTIKLSSDLVIRNPNITIAGQTAPSPGIALRGAGIWIQTSDVLLQHLRVRPGDDPNGPDPSNRDALKVSAPQPIARIVIDHCTFAWSIDEVASLINNWDNITLSNNILGDPLNDSLHPKGPHGFGVLAENGHITFVGNLFANNRDRNPLSRAGHLVFANNFVYNPGATVKLGTLGGKVTMNTLIGNVFSEGPDTRNEKTIRVIAGGTDGLLTGSKIYLDDNDSPDVTDDPWSIVGTYTVDGDVLRYRTNSPPTWPSNLTRLPVAQNVVKNSVLKNVGARPADRDSADRRLIDGIKSGTSRMINCVGADGSARCAANAGGWPVLASNRRALVIPANPNGLASNGYTNLEVWLHKMAAEVEGRPVAPPLAPRLLTAQ